MRAHVADNKRFLLALVLALVAWTAAMPFALMLDHRIDRTRPMHVDRMAMASLQHEYSIQHGTGLPITVASGESVDVGGKGFTPSVGTTLTVETVNEGFCIQATNQYGDVAEWWCWDYDDDPLRSVGFSPPEDLG